MAHRTSHQAPSPKPPPKPSLLRLTVNLIFLLPTLASHAQLPYITNPRHNGVGGHWQFLTIVALSLTSVILTLALLLDILSLLKARNPFLEARLLALKTTLSQIATPLELLIAVGYWGIFLYDRKLVEPPGHAVTLLVNVGLHLVPAVGLVVEFLSGWGWGDLGWRKAGAVGTVFFGIYWGWLEWCFKGNGWFPYPGLELLSMREKGVQCLFMAGVMAGCMMGLQWTYILVHGVRRGTGGERDVKRKD